MNITFSSPSGHDYGTLVVTPTSINVPDQLWWILNKIFPTGVFPFLDPSNTFEQLRRLPSQVPLRGIGPIRIYKS